MVTVVDATGAVLGRLASIVAKRLLNGEEIAIVNSEKAIIVGDKDSIKERYKEKREIGSSRKGPYFPRRADRIVKRTVRGMLPYQQPKGREALKRLKCYIGVPKEFEGVEFETIESVKKTPLRYITVGELSEFLGAKLK
ncbi:MAG: 50S ribosomal protein L13 [Thermoplasmata archaeon]|nr:50S ribosomal protein L13 [Thermoplasmata archaeon]